MAPEVLGPRGVAEKAHLALDLCGVILRDLPVGQVCRRPEEVDLPVEHHLRHQGHVEDKQGCRVDKYQGVILQTD